MSHISLYHMTEKVKTVIEFYFLLPDFKSRGHPSRLSWSFGDSVSKNVVIIDIG